jgi:hypothetical protein
MWTKNECTVFLKKNFGLEFTDIELEGFWNHLNQHKLTPTPDTSGNNVGFTPQMLQNLINIALERTGLSLNDALFKKVSEEIMPALVFTLFLKKISGVEHLIVSSDVPDIILVPYNQDVFELTNKRLGAFPLEMMFINKYAMGSAQGFSEEEKISDLIVSKKFNKQYVPETTLLVTLASDLENLNRKELSDFLTANGTNSFHQVWIFAGIDKDNSLIAQLCPTFREYILHAAKDLWPLMY